MGSPSGDVDDGFALAALLCSGVPLHSIGSVSGNTSELLAYANNLSMVGLLRSEVQVIHNPPPAVRVRVVALGPLTKIAGMNPEHVADLVIVGGNSSSRGRWPPLWPFEYNLTFDREASLKAFHLDASLTIVPLDVARRLSVSLAELDQIHGILGEMIRKRSIRWWRRSRWLWLTSRVPVWDLVAAMFVIRHDLFTTRVTTAKMHQNTWIEFDAGDRQVTLVTGFDRDQVWSEFLSIVNAAESNLRSNRKE